MLCAMLLIHASSLENQPINEALSPFKAGSQVLIQQDLKTDFIKTLFQKGAEQIPTDDIPLAINKGNYDLAGAYCVRLAFDGDPFAISCVGDALSMNNDDCVDLIAFIASKPQDNFLFDTIREYATFVGEHLKKLNDGLPQTMKILNQDIVREDS